MRSNGHDFMQLEMDLLKLKVLANESNEHFAKNAASTLK